MCTTVHRSSDHSTTGIWSLSWASSKTCFSVTKRSLQNLKLSINLPPIAPQPSAQDGSAVQVSCCCRANEPPLRLCIGRWKEYCKSLECLSGNTIRQQRSLALALTLEEGREVEDVDLGVVVRDAQVVGRSSCPVPEALRNSMPRAVATILRAHGAECSRSAWTDHCARVTAVHGLLTLPVETSSATSSF